MSSIYSARYREMLANLRSARLQVGLTQEQVAAALGRPQSFVSKVESGERRIDPIELQDLAKIYATGVLDLLPE